MEDVVVELKGVNGEWFNLTTGDRGVYLGTDPEGLYDPPVKVVYEEPGNYPGARYLNHRILRRDVVFGVEILNDGKGYNSWLSRDSEWRKAWAFDRDCELYITTPESGTRYLKLRLGESPEVKMHTYPQGNTVNRCAMVCIAGDPFWYEEDVVAEAYTTQDTTFDPNPLPWPWPKEELPEETLTISVYPGDEWGSNGLNPTDNYIFPKWILPGSTEKPAEPYIPGLPWLGAPNSPATIWTVPDYSFEDDELANRRVQMPGLIGGLWTNEVQRIYIDGRPTGGTFTLALGKPSDNLVTDGGFEDPAKDPDRDISLKAAGGVWEYSTEQAHSGTRSVKHTYAGGSSYPEIHMGPEGLDYYDKSTWREVLPGTKYRLSGWVYADGNNTGSNYVYGCMVRLGNADNTSYHPYAGGTAVADTWVKFEADITIPAGYDRMMFCGPSVRPGCDAGDQFWFDDLSVVALPETTGPIPYNCNSQDIKSALEALAQIAYNDVKVTRDRKTNEVQYIDVVGGATDGTYTLEFDGYETDEIDYNANSFEIWAKLNALDSTTLWDIRVTEEIVREEQIVTLVGEPQDGTFTLTLDGYTTDPIPWNAGAIRMHNELIKLPNIDLFDITVTKDWKRYAPWKIRFNGTGLAGVDVTELTGDPTGLIGGAGMDVEVETITQGSHRYRVEFLDELAAYNLPQMNVASESFEGGTDPEVVVTTEVDGSYPFVVEFQNNLGGQNMDLMIGDGSGFTSYVGTTPPTVRCNVAQEGHTYPGENAVIDTDPRVEQVASENGAELWSRMNGVRFRHPIPPYTERGDFELTVSGQLPGQLVTLRLVRAWTRPWGLE